MSHSFDFLPDNIEPLKNVTVVNSVNTHATETGFVRNRKINTDLLMQMRRAGKTQKECAEFFGCSISAISQQESRAVPPRPECLDKLTPSQERFVFAMAEGKNQTQAALSSYNCNENTAAVLGSRNMADPIIQECIHAVMADVGLTRRMLTTRLVEHVKSSDATTSIKAVDMGLRLTDSYPAEKRVNVNINAEAVAPVDLSRYRN